MKGCGVEYIVDFKNLYKVCFLPAVLVLLSILLKT